MIKVFGPVRTKFYDDYDIWAEAIKSKGWKVYIVHGGSAAHDVMGTCRGFWAHTAKKGWVEI